MKNFANFLCIATLSGLTLYGCSQVPEGPKTVTAEGIVTLNGTPVEGATIVFIGDNGEYSAHGISDESGAFSLDSFEYKTGAVPGSYKVVVTKTVEITEGDAKPMKGEEAKHAGEGEQLGIKNDLPAKYENPANGLAFVIPEDGTTDLSVELVAN